MSSSNQQSGYSNNIVAEVTLYYTDDHLDVVTTLKEGEHADC